MENNYNTNIRFCNSTDITSSPSVSTTKRQESLTNWSKPIPQNKHNKINKKLLDTVIYGNLAFNVVENLDLLDFLNEIVPNYNPPSANILHVQVLNHSFSTYLARKFEVIGSLTDIIVALNE
ncbi:6946_t:CDS:2 [Gigaspora rosea]|nr:6946_t:CDS:2 [Gigaspora rosea]